MTQQDAGLIVAIAAMAASVDGQQDPDEATQITATAERLGIANAANSLRQASAGQLDLGLLTAQLSDADARKAAYEVSAAVCNATGPASPVENAFLADLAQKLGLDTATASFADAASDISRTPIATTAAVFTPPSESASSDASASSQFPVSSASSPDSQTANTERDTHILDQAMLAAALELLPDRLANMAILPLQLRLVYTIGQQHGQQLDAGQVKDLAATFGIGAVAQVMEGIVRKAFGGLAGSLLGGFLGNSTGLAAGVAVTFAATYALGHAANQYYAQGRHLSTADMKALYTRFQGEGSTLYPKVQDRIYNLSRTTNFQSIMRAIRG